MPGLDLPNPFLQSIVPDAWEALTADAPALHEDGFHTCRAALEHVETLHQSRSILLRGQPGSGKTHLLARLRQAVAAPRPGDFDPESFNPPRAIFSFVRLQTGARSIARHVRRTLVDDLLRPGDGGLTQLEWIFLLRARPKLHKPEKFRIWWQSLRWKERSLIAEEQVDDLLERFERTAPLGGNLAAAMKHLVLDRRRRDACEWLRYGDLPDAAREALGMTPASDADPEEESLTLIRALAGLAGEHAPIVLCFDQIEALQSHPGDVTGLFAFGQLVSSLHDQTRNLLLISCVQSTFDEVLRRSVRDADIDRLADEAVLLKRPTWEEAEDLLVRRLESLPDVAASRRTHPGRLWPLPAEKARALVDDEHYSPRRLIAWCRAEFEQLRTGAAIAIPPTAEFLRQEFERALAAAAANWNAQATDNILLHGLPLVWSAGGRGDAHAAAGANDVDVLLETETGARPVCLCNASGNQLTNRLQRIRGQLERGELEHLVVVRNADRPLSPTATKALEHWQAIQAAGAVIVRPTREALMQLDAARRLLSAARAGDLSNSGESIDGDRAAAWFAENLPPTLRDLLDAVARPRELASTEAAALA